MIPLSDLLLSDDNMVVPAFRNAQDYQLLEKLAHQNRERIAERVVHAKGWGAHGTFTVTHDITQYTKPKSSPRSARRPK